MWLEICEIKNSVVDRISLCPFDSNALWESPPKYICCHNLAKNVAMKTITINKYRSYKAQVSTWEAGILPLNYARNILVLQRVANSYRTICVAKNHPKMAFLIIF